MDYADQLISEGRNNVNHHGEYTRIMRCPNSEELGQRSEWRDPRRYDEKAKRKIPECPSGWDGKVEMKVKETGMWTTIICPVCGYSEFWAAGDGDERF